MRGEGLLECDAGGSIDGDAGNGGVGAVDEDEDAGGGAALEAASVVVGDADGDAGFAGAHGGVHVGFGLDVGADAEDVRGGEGLDEAAALLGVGLVEDDGGDLANVGVNRVAEEEELDERDEQSEEEGGGVAQDVGELLAGDRAEAEDGAAHVRRPARTAGVLWGEGRVRVRGGHFGFLAEDQGPCSSASYRKRSTTRFSKRKSENFASPLLAYAREPEFESVYI